jgi:RNA polymerase sigma-70 factor (ECF subfamily)
MPPAPLHNEKEVLLRVARGDEPSFTLLFGHYQDSVYKSAWWYLKSHALAQEIVQEVFIKVWNKRADLPDVKSFSPWLVSMTKNYIIDYFRKIASTDKLQQNWASDMPQEEDNADHKVRTFQYERLLEQAIRELPPQQKAVYQLARGEGLSYEEIGRQLSISSFTVKTHMTRALGAIREFLRNHGEIYLLLLLLKK